MCRPVRLLAKADFLDLYSALGWQPRLAPNVIYFWAGPRAAIGLLLPSQTNIAHPPTTDISRFVVDHDFESFSWRGGTK